MEITLEKIELVKDRTGVSYREAKEALEAANGEVVEAIIAIEDDINSKGKSPDVKAQADKVLEKIKYYIGKGNVSKISIKKDGEVVVNIPVTVGIVGTALAPWLTIIGAVTAFGTKCEVELIKDDGEIIDITSKYDDIAQKGGDVFETVKEKGKDALEKAKDTKENFGEIKEIFKEHGSTIKDAAKSAAVDIKETYRSSGENADSADGEDQPAEQDSESEE